MPPRMMRILISQEACFQLMQPQVKVESNAQTLIWAELKTFWASMDQCRLSSSEKVNSRLMTIIRPQ